MTRAHTLSLFISASLPLLASCLPRSEVGLSDQLCPASMFGAGSVQYPLTDLYVMRFETGKGSQNVPFEGNTNNKRWYLVWADGVRYEAVCDYDGQVIARPIGAMVSQCRLEGHIDRHRIRHVRTSCE